ncbi:MAG: hypothetical protein EOP06_17455 [Proteobacteria bacterium]|nr:MAG: hypothetical protein EOP06_17455 [Pseudomonadota bacterium]
MDESDYYIASRDIQEDIRGSEWSLFDRTGEKIGYWLVKDKYFDSKSTVFSIAIFIKEEFQGRQEELGMTLALLLVKKVFIALGGDEPIYVEYERCNEHSRNLFSKTNELGYTRFVRGVD